MFSLWTISDYIFIRKFKIDIWKSFTMCLFINTDSYLMWCNGKLNWLCVSGVLINIESIDQYWKFFILNEARLVVWFAAVPNIPFHSVFMDSDFLWSMLNFMTFFQIFIISSIELKNNSTEFIMKSNPGINVGHSYLVDRNLMMVAANNNSLIICHGKLLVLFLCPLVVNV